MSVRGIEFHTEESPQAIAKSADRSLSLKTNKGTVEGFSHIMFATGRRPNTKVWNNFCDSILSSKCPFGNQLPTNGYHIKHGCNCTVLS